MRPGPITLLALGLAACAGPAGRPERQSDLAGAVAPLFEADGATAVARLKLLAPDQLDAKDLAHRDCILARLGSSSTESAADGSVPRPVKVVLDAYRTYWTGALNGREKRAQAEATLAQQLRSATGSQSADPDQLGAAAIELVQAQGLHALGGVTPPLREFLVWRQQAGAVQTIELPDDRIEVSVTYLDGFLSTGWLGWATCDRNFTGGWTTREGMMVVRPAWDLASEDFRVSLLAHESQHFSDYRRFPKLEAPDLEYRAKLVELSLAEATQGRLLDTFGVNADRNRASPHAFANYWVTTRLSARLGVRRLADSPAGAVRAAALAELAAHTRELEAAGAIDVMTVLPD